MAALNSTVLAALAVFGMAAPAAALAQAAPAETAAPATPPPAPWSTSCAGADRTNSLDCVIEQRVVLSNTGQLLTAVTVRVPSDTRQPVVMVQTPFGLYLPGGLKLSVDEAAPTTLPLQTCNANGCYAGSALSADLLAAMQRGTTLSVTFQDLQQQDIAVPVSLLGFTAAFDRIK